MIVVAAVTAFVLAAMAVLLFKSWWALGIALAAHGLGTTTVVIYALRRADRTGDKPDPINEARLEEEKVELKERRRRTGQLNPAKDYEVF